MIDDFIIAVQSTNTRKDLNGSQDVQNAGRYLRVQAIRPLVSRFAWVNTLFGELVLKVYHERPQLLRPVI